MLNSLTFKIWIILINLDQDTVLNWFGLGNIQTNSKDFFQITDNDHGVTFSDVEIEPSANVSLETLKLLLTGLLNKVQDGLTLADIEFALFFIIFVRFIILAIKYNLKTSFLITMVGILAGYLWYRHFIDLISNYRNTMIRIPFLHKMGVNAIQLRVLHRQSALSDFKLGANVHWYNPAKVIYYALTKGIIHTDPESRTRYYIDPISMIMSRLNVDDHSRVIELYYKIYNGVIPKLYKMITSFWRDLSGLAAYATITRIGKRYCPYLIRWHWTFLLIISMVERTLEYFVRRMMYFKAFVLIPIAKEDLALRGAVNPSVAMQMSTLNVFMVFIVLAHIGLILFGMFHAIWGQYFYIPFFVDNTELHTGPRPKTSVYSGGKTSWQDPEEKEKNFNRLIPKLWYGWFGKGTKKSSTIVNIIKKIIQSILDRINKKKL
jgi:hypothetical protein